MYKFIQKYLSDESGATAIEYALIATGIALAIVTVVFALGDELLLMYNEVLTIFV